MSAPAIITHAPPAIWAAARYLITAIFNIFGAPEAIAAQDVHSKAERNLLLKWLRAGEAMLRHLLLIEAAAYADLPHSTRKRAPRVRVRRLMSFTADKPEDWRVSFRYAASPAAGGAARARGEAKRFHSAWPLAERAEALLRAFNDPAPFARRLAHRLRAAPKSVEQLTLYPPNLRHVIDEADFVALRESAGTARKRFNSS